MRYCSPATVAFAGIISKGTSISGQFRYSFASGQGYLAPVRLPNQDSSAVVLEYLRSLTCVSQRQPVLQYALQQSFNVKLVIQFLPNSKSKPKGSRYLNTSAMIMVCGFLILLALVLMAQSRRQPGQPSMKIRPSTRQGWQKLQAMESQTPADQPPQIMRQSVLRMWLRRVSVIYDHSQSFRPGIALDDLPQPKRSYTHPFTPFFYSYLSNGMKPAKLPPPPCSSTKVG